MPRWQSVLSALSVTVVAVLLSSTTALAGSGDRTGSDLNTDGYDDLVVGVPSEGLPGILQPGVINALYGSSSGIAVKGDDLFGQNDLGGSAEDRDRCGNALAYGDFDGDGHDDAAVGAPGEDWKGHQDAGVVHIMFGSPSGLDEDNTQLLSQFGAMAGANEEGDFFGAVLAAGNFDNDKYDDLVIGVPGEDVGKKTAAGAIIIAFGGPSGIKTKGSKYITQKGKVPGKSERIDAFGVALAVGDFNGDDHDDLVIGTPGEDIGSVAEAGNVTVLYGKPEGISKDGDGFSQSGLDDVMELDQFGYKVAAGNFNGDEYDDVAVGAPGEDVGGVEDAGSVTILLGGPEGVTTAGATIITQDLADAAQNEEGDQMGSSLAAGNFNGDDFDDLAVGLPYEDVGAAVDAGRVLVINGTAGGLDPTASQSISQANLPNGGPQAGDWTGFSLRVGNFNGDSATANRQYDDLAVSSPREDVSGRRDNGVIHVIYGGASGLDAPGGTRFHQGVRKVEGKPEAGDRFGSGL